MEVDIPIIIGISLFYLVMLAAGFWSSRRKGTGLDSKNAEDIMLAGRNLGLLVGIFTLTATEVGGGFINGTAEEVYKRGLLWCQLPFGYAISIAINGLFFAKKLRKRNYVTMFDLFQETYGNHMGIVVFILHFMGDVFWISAILAVLGDTLQTVSQIDRTSAILASGGIALVYTLMGGMASVAFTDVIQLGFLAFGLWLSVPFVVTNEHVRPLPENWSFSDWMGTVENREIPIYIDSFLVGAIGGLPWQAYYQRVFAIKSENRVRVLSVTAAFLAMFMGLPSIIVGATAKYVAWNETALNRDLELSEATKIMPFSLQLLTPRPVAFFGLGAVAAAVMSSIDSAMLGSASCLTRNVYVALIRPKASEREQLWTTRIAIFIVGVVGTGVAFVIGSIYDIMFLASDLLYVTIVPQFFGAVLLPSWCSPIGSAASYLVAFVLRMLTGNLGSIETIIPFPFYDWENNRQLFPFRTTIVLISFIVNILVGRLTRGRSRSGTAVINSHPEPKSANGIEKPPQIEMSEVYKNGGYLESSLKSVNK